MALPATVVLVRGDLPPLDLTPSIEPGSLTWSSVVPGGFAACGFTINGDFRRLIKLLPYLSIIRVLGDAGNVLWEGQIEDLAPSLSQDVVGLRVGAFGLQNLLREHTLRRAWIKRNLNWDTPIPPGTSLAGLTQQPPSIVTVTTGTYDPTSLSKTGISCVPAAAGVTFPNFACAVATVTLPVGMVGMSLLRGFMDQTGTDAGSTKFQELYLVNNGTAWGSTASIATTGTGISISHPFTAGTAIALGVRNISGAGVALAANDLMQIYDTRLIGVVSDEDVVDSIAASVITFGGMNGGTLIRSLIAFIPQLTAGIIEAGTDYQVDTLDTTEGALSFLDIMQEIASYYTREWAVWEDARLDWRSPNLAQAQWIIPLGALSRLELDASVENAFSVVYVNFTDALAGVPNRAASVVSDRRNPYVSTGHGRDLQVDGGTMTSGTAAQLAARVAQNVGYGPVPAAGSIDLPGEALIQHASGSTKKAWEIRAGENVMLPELPMSDVFTQDGRGEILFHIVSAEANSEEGIVTLELDSYGSKRSDVLMARLAAVTNALGG